MAVTKDWTFRQIGGDGKILTLAGRAAPHGRQRRNPVVTDAISLRRERVYYADRDGPPTTHVFGHKWEDWELRGRFEDQWLGAGETKSRVDAWKVFCADAQPVEISWGDIVTVRGIVDKFVAGRESEAHSTYAITVLIDQQLVSLNAHNVAVAPRAASALAAALQEATTGLAALPTRPDVGAISPSLLDTLDDLVSSVNTFSASLLTIAGEIDDFTSGSIAQLERLRAGVVQVRTAMNRVRSTMETAEVTTANAFSDDALLWRSADSEVVWSDTRTEIDIATLEALALLAEMDRQAEIAQRGRILSLYVARGGDTFEGIARQFYGGIEQAGRIRDANGAQYGELPVAGRSYAIPSSE